METYIRPMPERKTAVTAEQLAQDLKVAARDASGLVRAKVADLNVNTRNRLSGAWDAIKETCNRAGEKTAQGAKATDRCIRNHPYQTIGVFLGVGLILGLLMARKSD